MPEGSECPPACYTPAPSECQEGEVVCDSGVSDDGCWLGDYCMAEGTVCPTVQGVAIAQGLSIVEGLAIAPPAKGWQLSKG